MTRSTRVTLVAFGSRFALPDDDDIDSGSLPKSRPVAAAVAHELRKEARRLANNARNVVAASAPKPVRKALPKPVADPIKAVDSLLARKAKRRSPNARCPRFNLASNLSRSMFTGIADVPFEDYDEPFNPFRTPRYVSVGFRGDTTKKRRPDTKWDDQEFYPRFDFTGAYVDTSWPLPEVVFPAMAAEESSVPDTAVVDTVEDKFTVNGRSFEDINEEWEDKLTRETGDLDLWPVNPTVKAWDTETDWYGNPAGDSYDYEVNRLTDEYSDYDPYDPDNWDDLCPECSRFNCDTHVQRPSSKKDNRSEVFKYVRVSPAIDWVAIYTGYPDIEYSRSA